MLAGLVWSGLVRAGLKELFHLSPDAQGIEVLFSLGLDNLLERVGFCTFEAMLLS